MPDLRLAGFSSLVDDQEERGQGHQLPEQQEREHVVRGGDQEHREDEEVEQEPSALTLCLPE